MRVLLSLCVCVCEQVNYFKDKSDDVCQRSSGEYFSGSIKYGGGCGCRRCDFHQLPYDDMMGSAISEFSKWEDTFKYQPCQPEERRMSNLSDWAPSVNSTIDIQLQLDNEQDIYNLRKECEEKDITIKELSLSLDSSKHVRSKRVSELEDIIRRKNTLITKLKKDKMILEQKPMRRSCGFDYLKPDSDSAECSHGLEAFQQSTNGINKYQILEKNCPRDAPQLRRSLSDEKRAFIDRFGEASLSAPSVSDCRVDARWLFGYWLNDEKVQKGLHIRKGTIGTWVRCNRDSLAFETVIWDVRPYHANLSTKGYRSLVYSDSMMDPSSVFGMLFGSEFFENYVGQLALDSMAPAELDIDDDVPEVLTQKVQEKMKDFCGVMGIYLNRKIWMIEIEIENLIDGQSIGSTATPPTASSDQDKIQDYA